MTAWDGTGVDPWLPARLAHETRITTAERRVYAAWWGSLSDLLVRSKRGVLATHSPDPHAIWALVPLWAERMTTLVYGLIRDTVGEAFRALFGDDYLFDSRPAVTNYLAEVLNRMVRTPDEVFDIVAATVARGAGQGDSIPVIAERIDEILSATKTDRWTNRATVVARTETIGALNAGRGDAYNAVADALGGDFEHMWLGTIDTRIRPAHLAADQQRQPLGQPFIVGGEPLMRPGDPLGSADNVIQCRCSELLLPAGENPDLRGRAGADDWDDWWASQIANQE